MAKRMEFFFDYVSSYSYLANSQLATLGAEEIVYRPMLLGGVLKATGNAPPMLVQARATYLLRDLQRWADHYQLPFRMNPLFPQNTLKALRLALVARREGRFEVLHQPMFDAIWVHGRDLSNDAVLLDLAAKAGLDADRCLQECADDAIKAELQANTEEAVSRGVFGAPTVFVNGEMFFGNDRLDFIRAALAAR
ncbi:MAG: 2-hydroxychromene-2-carboxylate isomerase [Woeseia sp.]